MKDSLPFSRVVSEKLGVTHKEASKIVAQRWTELRKRVGEAGIIRLERLSASDPKAFLRELQDDGSDAALWFLSVILNPGRPN